MGRRRSRLPQRIEKRRQQGQSAAEIARYVHSTCGSCWSKKIPWTSEELEELERLDRDVAERKAERTKSEAEAAERRAAWRASLPPPPPNLGREGLSPKAARELLDCSVSELNRWAEDGRLPPDGQRFYYGVGNGAKKLWGRAWLFDSVADALSLVAEWRVRDEELEQKRSETALFELVRGTFPDAVRQWSPPWLGRLSVDIYVPCINLAIEYQGRQHYEPVARFGGEKGFRDGQDCDARKRKLLSLHGVALIEWHFKTPFDDAELARALEGQHGEVAGINEPNAGGG